jgi:hypothetical protein
MKEGQMARAHGSISVFPNVGPIAGTFDEVRGASLNPFLFKPEAISAETLAANEKFRKATAGAPNWWEIGAPAVRAIAASGKGAFPRPEKSYRASTIHVDGKGGHRVALRVIAPQRPRGAYMFMHGGDGVRVLRSAGSDVGADRNQHRNGVRQR